LAIDLGLQEEQRRPPDGEDRLPVDELGDPPHLSAHGPHPRLSGELPGHQRFHVNARVREDSPVLPDGELLDRRDDGRRSGIVQELLEENGNGDTGARHPRNEQRRHQGHPPEGSGEDLPARALRAAVRRQDVDGGGRQGRPAHDIHALDALILGARHHRLEHGVQRGGGGVVDDEQGRHTSPSMSARGVREGAD